MRIALVKQEIYPDLYVCGPEERSPINILRSSIMRTGPIGLFESADCTFHIVRQGTEPECSAAYTQGDFNPESARLLREKGPLHLPGMEWLKPGCSRPQGELAVDPESIDWSDYDVVISINIAIPSRLLARHRRTLFCYMMSEASKKYSRWAGWGYDQCLNQNIRGRIDSWFGGPIDFPYTFLGPDTLQSLLTTHLGRSAQKTGLYAEVNMTRERPVANPPEILLPLLQSGMRVRLHKQSILENLCEIFDARYFVKLGGRAIRGNAIAEAISCGTVVLADPALLIQRELLPAWSFVNDVNSLQILINKLDTDPGAYAAAISEQKDRLRFYGLDCPMTALRAALDRKRRMAGGRWGQIGQRLLRKIAPARYYYHKHFGSNVRPLMDSSNCLIDERIAARGEARQ